MVAVAALPAGAVPASSLRRLALPEACPEAVDCGCSLGWGGLGVDGDNRDETHEAHEAHDTRGFTRTCPPLITPSCQQAESTELNVLIV